MNESTPESSMTFDPNGPCVACGSPSAKTIEISGDQVRLCPACAAFDGLGCP